MAATTGRGRGRRAWRQGGRLEKRADAPLRAEAVGAHATAEHAPDAADVAGCRGPAEVLAAAAGLLGLLHREKLQDGRGGEHPGDLDGRAEAVVDGRGQAAALVQQADNLQVVVARRQVHGRVALLVARVHEGDLALQQHHAHAEVALRRRLVQRRLAAAVAVLQRGHLARNVLQQGHRRAALQLPSSKDVPHGPCRVVWHLYDLGQLRQHPVEALGPEHAGKLALLPGELLHDLHADPHAELVDLLADVAQAVVDGELGPAVEAQLHSHPQHADVVQALGVRRDGAGEPEPALLVQCRQRGGALHDVPHVLALCIRLYEDVRLRLPLDTQQRGILPVVDKQRVVRFAAVKLHQAAGENAAKRLVQPAGHLEAVHV